MLQRTHADPRQGKPARELKHTRTHLSESRLKVRLKTSGTFRLSLFFSVYACFIWMYVYAPCVGIHELGLKIVVHPHVVLPGPLEEKPVFSLAEPPLDTLCWVPWAVYTEGLDQAGKALVKADKESYGSKSTTCKQDTRTLRLEKEWGTCSKDCSDLSYSRLWYSDFQVRPGDSRSPSSPWLHQENLVCV